MAIQKLLLANELRQKDICIDYFYNKNPKMRQQLDYVFKTKIPYMIVIGDNEIKTGVVKFKNINENKEITINRENIVTHLQDQHIS
jgi:histidyl-tRNA synthetase